MRGQARVRRTESGTSRPGCEGDQARTPWGRANLVGRFLETGAAPDAARRYVDALTALAPASVAQDGGIIPGFAFGPSRPRTVGVRLGWNFD